MAGEFPHDRGLRMDRAGKPPGDEDKVEAILTRLEKRLSLIRSEHKEVARALEEIVLDIRTNLKKR
ncbi:MAG TPA: hypothetical protein VFH89_10910 [Sphingomicrobium sp.]|nr:hypothetical protein [Sphingomicrobium sp.]